MSGGHVTAVALDVRMCVAPRRPRIPSPGEYGTIDSYLSEQGGGSGKADVEVVSALQNLIYVPKIIAKEGGAPSHLVRPENHEF